MPASADSSDARAMCTLDTMARSFTVVAISVAPIAPTSTSTRSAVTTAILAQVTVGSRDAW